MGKITEKIRNLLKVIAMSNCLFTNVFSAIIFKARLFPYLLTIAILLSIFRSWSHKLLSIFIELEHAERISSKTSWS